MDALSSKGMLLVSGKAIGGGCGERVGKQQQKSFPQEKPNLPKFYSIKRKKWKTVLILG